MRDLWAVRSAWLALVASGCAHPSGTGLGDARVVDGGVGADSDSVTCTSDTNPCLVDVVYGTSSSGIALTLDYWRPVGRARGPAVILIHGGGWLGGDKASQYDEAYDLSGHGLAVFNINYRLRCLTTETPGVPPGLCDQGPGADTDPHIWTIANPVPLQDVRAAIDWVAHNGIHYGCYYNSATQKVDTIGALGTSAGGQLALMGAVHAGNPQPFDAVVAMSPLSDFDYCGAVNDAGIDPVSGMTAITGPGGNTCAYDARQRILGELDYAGNVALWRDMSPTANVDGQNHAAYFLTNGSGLISPGESIPYEESENFANAAHAASADNYIEQYHLDTSSPATNCHADGCWQVDLPASGGLQFAPVSPAPNHFGQVVKDAVVDFLWARSSALAAARGDITD